MKKLSLRRILTLLLSALLLGGTVMPTSVSAAEDTNVAKGKRAIACHSENSSLTPDKALDGNTNTRFAAGAGCGDNTWYVLDLGDTYDLSSVRINWETARPSRCVLEVSDDGQTFAKLATVTDVPTGWKETAVKGTGRFLRIREEARAVSAYGFSMWELEVYGHLNTAKPNKDAFYEVSAESLRGGSLTLSASGYVKSGTTVTVTVNPGEGNAPGTLTVNGKEITVTDGKGSFTVSGKTTVSGSFVQGVRSRFECEDAAVFQSDGKTPVAMDKQADKDASGGFIAGTTGGKYFLFENVKEGNTVRVAYASPSTNCMSLLIRFPGDTSFHDAGVINFSTTNGWTMANSYIAASAPTYIPEGSDIMIHPNVDVNLDYLFITSEVSTAEPPKNTVTAGMLSDAAETDIMAGYGKSLSLTAGQSVTFTVPDGAPTYNVLSLTYAAQTGAVISLTLGGRTLASGSLPASSVRTFVGTGWRVDDYKPGDKLTLTVTSGSLLLSHVTVNTAGDAETVTVPSLPAAGERLTVPLDGIWAVTTDTFGSWDVPRSVPELAFINTIPVPGLWHSAAFDLGSYTGHRMWYEKEIVLDEEPDGNILLRIGAAQYGRYIYVNGQYVGEYAYNYSESFTDLSGLLHKGKNTLVIMLGDWAQQYSDPKTPAHVLNDGESTTNKPGITDSVELIFTRTPAVTALQTASDLTNGALDLKVTLSNLSSADVTTALTVRVFELGIFKDGVPDRAERQVASYTYPSSVTVKKNGKADVMLTAIPLADWARDKCWSPASPFLYRVEVSTDGDTYSTRFGMRTFAFENGNAMLNGQVITLFGTNVAVERFFDDPLCLNNPWDEDWIRKLYAEYQSCHWFSFRTHLGGANSKWFDIADEMGFMIFDEYANWGENDGCTLATITPEIKAWIDERGRHPSVIVFDAMNEGSGALVHEFIRMGREYDIQHRPWDSGWLRPEGKDDSIECHPYILGSKGMSALQDFDNTKPLVTTANIGWTAEQYAGHAFILNEHGELWLSRPGVPMSGTAATWNNTLPHATDEQRLTYYAEVMAAQMECFRAGRAYAGILFFCGLGSSPVGAVGVTSDILMPDVSTPDALQIRPYTQKMMRNAFAPLGICIENYLETFRRGEQVTLPVTLINDTGRDVEELEVTIKIMSGSTLLYAERTIMSVNAFTGNRDGVATKELTVTVPAFRDFCANGKTLTVTASYTMDGETVSSQRKWKLSGGSFTDDPIPTYDWLEPETEPVTEPETQPEPQTEPTTAPADTAAPSETTAPAPETQTAPAAGCRSNASVSVLLTLLTIAAACALLSAKKKRKS